MPSTGGHRPIEFSASLRTATSSGDWLSQVRDVERRGYSVLYVPDHVDDQRLAPLVALAAAAGSTEVLTLGTLVLNNELRHPAVLAHEAASLDILSDGRYELGLGMGWNEGERRQLAMELRSPAVRLARLQESLEIILGLWTDSRFHFEGTHYSILPGATCPRPVKIPHPPILIGGSRRGLLSVAARYGDVVNLMPPNGDSGGQDPATRNRNVLFDQIDWVREQAGSRADNLIIATNIMVVERSDRAGRSPSRLSQGRSSQIPLEGLVGTPGALQGDADAIAGQLVEWKERGISRFNLHYPRHLDDFQDVIDRLRPSSATA